MKNILKTVIALIIAFFFTGLNYLFSQVPKICRLQGGQTKTVWGTGFNPSETEVYSSMTTFNETIAIEALKDVNYSSESFLPSSPTSNAKKLNILSCDDQGSVMAVEFSDEYNSQGFFDGRLGDDILWIKNQSGYSKPWLIKTPQLWFSYPEKVKAGELIRVFGRNVNAKLVAIRKKGDKELIILLDSKTKNRKPLLVHNVSYEASIRLPETLASGNYEIYIHNGSGGPAGWSKSLNFSVEDEPKKTIYYEAKRFGVRADGHTDDTKNLRKALSTASKTGGVVLLQSGRVIISETIELPSGVSIEGAGEGATTLQVLDNNPMKGGLPKDCILMNYASDWFQHIKDYTPMIWARNKSSIKDISLIYGNGVGFGIMIANSIGISENIHIERVKVLANNQPDGWHGAYSILVGGDTYGLTISDCDFRGWGGIEVIANNHHQAYVGRNKIVTLPTGLQNSFFTRGFNKSIIESNEVFYGLRNYSSQNGMKSGKRLPHGSSFNVPRSTTHLVMIGNVYVNNLARRHNDGEMMIESNSGFWCGKISKSGKTDITVNGEPFDAELSDNYVIVLNGKGIGQYRRIISNTKNSLKLEKDWEIPPDETSYIQVGGFNVEHLWIDNTLTNNASWSGFWGNNVGHVVDGQTMRDGGPLVLWAFDNKSPSTVAFIDVIGCRTIGGGGISILGKPAFGNTIRYCEVVDFSYYPNFHIQPNWLKSTYQKDRYGISFNSTFLTNFECLPTTTSLRSWNIFEGNHLENGPNGIFIQNDVENTIIKRNMINVDKEQINNQGSKTLIK